MEIIKRVGKRIVCFILSAVIILCGLHIFCACTANNRYDGELLRLHIRANSDDEADQAVKLKVRDAVNEYVSANVKKSSFAAAYADIGARLDAISALCSQALYANGFGYGARARLTNEYFPSRKYGDTVVPEGYYDALIIELGEAKGNNWWCVIYPPLCYGSKLEYRSFFAELFDGACIA